MLNAFLESPRSFVRVGDILEYLEAEMDDRFLFHMQILEDQHFVERLDRAQGLGYEVQMGGEFEWRSYPCD